MTIIPGSYSITNVKAGTAITLSAVDDRSIVGDKFNNQANQKVRQIFMLHPNFYHNTSTINIYW